ncbi:hypothetical protein RJ55_06277 [Drechmeria coniospora]|nr:hypothetical protein RJ55_06277 [Drechmeria coniospora]
MQPLLTSFARPGKGTDSAMPPHPPVSYLASAAIRTLHPEMQQHIHGVERFAREFFFRDASNPLDMVANPQSTAGSPGPKTLSGLLDSSQMRQVGTAQDNWTTTTRKPSGSPVYWSTKRKPSPSPPQGGDASSAHLPSTADICQFDKGSRCAAEGCNATRPQQSPLAGQEVHV